MRIKLGRLSLILGIGYSRVRLLAQLHDAATFFHLLLLSKLLWALKKIWFLIRFL